MQNVHPQGLRATTLSRLQIEHWLRPSASVIRVLHRPQFVVVMRMQPESDHNVNINNVYSKYVPTRS